MTSLFGSTSVNGTQIGLTFAGSATQALAVAAPAIALVVVAVSVEN